MFGPTSYAPSNDISVLFVVQLLTALDIAIDMHPLALEDVLHNRGHARSKADYYPKHLFLRLLCHTIAGEDEVSTGSTPHGSVTNLPRSNSPVPIDDDEENEEDLKGGQDGVYAVDDEKTVYGNGTGSRFSTIKGGPIQSYARRRIHSMGDLENQGAAGARFSDVSAIEQKVCSHD